jgi:hypothetical protein
MPRAIAAGLFRPMAHPSNWDGGGAMPGDPIEPLEWNLWCDSLRGLLRQHSAGLPLEACLRLAYHLAALAPSPFSQVVRTRCDEQLFERLLAEAEYDAAVICLMGEAVSFEVAREPRSHRVVARAWLAEFPEARGTAASSASALLAAWLELLASFEPSRTPISRESPSRDRSRSQSGRRPKRSAH